MLLRPFPYILSMASAKQRNWKAIEIVSLAFSGAFHMSSFGSLRRGERYTHARTYAHTHTHTYNTHTHHTCTHTHSTHTYAHKTHTHIRTQNTHTYAHKTHTHIYTEFMDKSNFKKPGLCQAGWYTAGLLTVWICLFSKYNLYKS